MEHYNLIHRPAAVGHARWHPDAGQLNALETTNIRGERSVTRKGDFDRAPLPVPACRRSNSGEEIPQERTRSTCSGTG
jgi:hypothetical protein